MRAGDLVIAQLEVPVAAVSEAFGLALDRGATTVLNPSPTVSATDVMAVADIVVVNEHEAADLTGADESTTDVGESIRRARELGEGRRSVIVTLGGAGLVAVDRAGAATTVAGVPVRPVDTVGAGDCFLGVLAASLAAGTDWPASLDLANRAAALSVTRRGAVLGMPRRDELRMDRSRERGGS